MTGRVDRLKKEFGIAARWVAFPLAPNNPEEGIDLERYFRLKGSDVDLDDMMARLSAVAKEEGLKFSKRTHSYNSRLAHEIGKWVEENGKGDEWHTAMFVAYFGEGLNIGKWEVVEDALIRLGLDAKEAKQTWQEHRYAEAVDQDWRMCRKMGVRAAPTFSYQGRMLVGAQPYEELQRLVSQSPGGIFL